MNHYQKYKKYKQKYKEIIAGSQTNYLTPPPVPNLPLTNPINNPHTHPHTNPPNNLYQKHLARDQEPLLDKFKHITNNYWQPKHTLIDDRPAHSLYPTTSDQSRGLDNFDDSSQYTQNVKQILPTPPGTSKYARHKKKKLQNKVQHAFDQGEPLTNSEHQQHMEYADSSHWTPPRTLKNSYTQWNQPATSSLTPQQRGLEY